MGLRIGRNLNLLLASVGLLALAVGVYLIWESGGSSVPPLEPASAVDPARSERTAPLPEPATPAPTPPAAESIETQPFDARHDLERQLGALIDPDFGPLLERAEARMDIAVVDALGQPLDPMGWDFETHTRVWRQEGAGWQRAPAKWDIGRLVAGGGPDAGLEPGDHEAALSLGSYGIGQINFRVERGEHGRAALRMPGWRRVVILHFVDPEGRPIPYLGAVPRFSAAASAPLPDRPKAPEVLRDAPHRDRIYRFRGGSRSAWSSHREMAQVCYPTDEGRYAVPVIAGVGGQIRLDIDRRLFLNPGAKPLQSNFSGTEWDDYVIRIEPRPDYATKVAAWRKIHPKDPGRRRHAHKRPAPRRATTTPASPDPFDLGNLRGSRFRLLVNLDVPQGVYAAVCKDGRVEEILHPPTADAFVHTDLRPAPDRQVVATDGAFCWGDAHPIEEPAKKTLVRVNLEEAPLPCSLNVRTTPTLAAWARAVSFALSSDVDGQATSTTVRRQLRPARRDGEWHGYETFLSDGKRQALEHAATLHLGYAAKAGTTLGYDTKGEVEPGDNLKHLTLPLTRDHRDALRNGRLELDLPQELARTRAHPIIALRCVGDREEGIPWVEASIVPAEDDALAQAMRHVSESFAEKARRPNADQLIAAARAPGSPPVQKAEVDFDVDLLEEEVFEEDDDEETARITFVEVENPADAEIPPMPGLDLLESALGADTLAAYGKAGLRRLWTQGAWYDTHSKLKSDADGYVISTKQHLAPGRAYILYLWSHSRDDLQPDRRVVFEATPGITDLGVIRLPSH